MRKGLSRRQILVGVVHGQYGLLALRYRAGSTTRQPPATGKYNALLHSTLKVSRCEGRITFTFDPPLAWPEGEANGEVAWSGEELLVPLDAGPGSIVTFLYDSSGERVGILGPVSTPTTYVYDFKDSLLRPPTLE